MEVLSALPYWLFDLSSQFGANRIGYPSPNVGGRSRIVKMGQQAWASSLELLFERGFFFLKEFQDGFGLCWLG